MAECTSRSKALEIIDLLIANYPKAGAKSKALQSIRDWIFISTHDIPETHEERKAYLEELELKLRNLRSDEERISYAHFYLEGLGKTIIEGGKDDVEENQRTNECPMKDFNHSASAGTVSSAVRQLGIGTPSQGAGVIDNSL